MKFKEKMEGCSLNVTIKLNKSGEDLNAAELENVSRLGIRWFMKPEKINGNQLVYTGPMGISIESCLNGPITKRRFLKILKQICSVIGRMYDVGMPVYNLLLDLKHSYINEATNEIRFIYLPLAPGQINVNLLQYLSAIIYNSKPASYEDTECINRIREFFARMSPFDIKKLEAEVDGADRQLKAEMERNSDGYSGFMTDKRQDYYAHYDTPNGGRGGNSHADFGNGVQNNSSGAGNDFDDSTGLLEDNQWENTGLLDENNYSNSSDAQDVDDSTGLLDESAASSSADANFPGSDNYTGAGTLFPPDYYGGMNGPAGNYGGYSNNGGAQNGGYAGANGPAGNYGGYSNNGGAQNGGYAGANGPAGNYGGYSNNGGAQNGGYAGANGPAGNYGSYSNNGGAQNGGNTKFPDDGTALMDGYYENTDILGGNDATGYNHIRRQPNDVNYQEDEYESSDTTLLNENMGGGMGSSGVHFPKLIRKSTGEAYAVNKPVYRIGKERNYVDCFVANNSAVSRSHADIVSRGNKYFIIDLNSKNHTYVDGQIIPVQYEVEIRNNTRITLANEEFVFET